MASRFLVFAALLAGCALDPGTREPGSSSAPLKLDPNFVNPNDPSDSAEPARDYTLFEADPVRPIAVLERSGLVAVANTSDDFLDVFRPRPGGIERCGSIKVGMRPVAVAAVREGSSSAELWVVNHLSDSISVVSLDLFACRGDVTRTIQVGDEPRDIVVAKTRRGGARVFVTGAHRGQHHPVASARNGTDLVMAAGDKPQRGLADVFVFDPAHPAEAPRVVNLFSDTPRALAVSGGIVYAAGFHTGNRTSIVPAELAAERGADFLRTLLAEDEDGEFIEQDGELVLRAGAQGVEKIRFGLRAVAGFGRCMPDPREARNNRFFQQVCVETDAENRALRVLLQRPGVVTPSCQCTSGDGTPQPTTALIVQFFDTPEACGEAFMTFPDGVRGCWLDADPAGARTPALLADRQSPPMAFNENVKLSLPDQDVFAIDVDRLVVRKAFSGVGTILFGMAAQPGTGRLFVTNTEARNLTRFEGSGEVSSSTVRGHLHESRITAIEPISGRVVPVHLNDHIDYSTCCERVGLENQKSFAFPTSGAFASNGRDFLFTALGSDKLGVVRASALGEGFQHDRARRRGELRDVWLGQDMNHPAGPVALAIDGKRGRVYVKTHFTNELVTLSEKTLSILDRDRLPNPEPDSIAAGRHVLYNARLTSSHGDSACASCHVFGNFDSLSWDLGDPTSATVDNPGPFALPTDVVEAPIALDPNAPADTPDFRSNKGPMSTQTLRGMANHGSQHWRGDRVRRFQDTPGVQPNFGIFNEDNSFGEFDVAIQGLNGNDVALAPQVFQQFTNFALQLTLPPNPIRNLDDTLTADQAAARALFFGCLSMTDSDFAAGECVGQDGTRVAIDSETHACACSHNPLVNALRNLPDVYDLGLLIQGLLRDPAFDSAFDDFVASERAGLPPEAAELGDALGDLQAAAAAFASSELSYEPGGLLAQAGAEATAAALGAFLKVVGLSERLGVTTGQGLLELFSSSLPDEALPPDSPLRTAVGLLAAFGDAFAAVNIDLRVLSDEAARGTAEFRDLLRGCSLEPSPVCRLRVTDSFQTCHGCHRLDPKGNAEFDVFRPGFFGSDGQYSFENESQVFKVPHLRNMYQKVGMFGQSSVPFFLPESVLGPRRGGPFAPEGAYLGAQVRGFGFFHDGSVDTLHRFHGAAVFAGRPVGLLGSGDPGNPGGLEVALPSESTRAACIASFRGAPPDALTALPEELRAIASLCLAGGPLPEVCFSDPSDAACQEALAAVAEVLGDPGFPERFPSELLPFCFQLGSLLEGGERGGVCFPEGLVQREQMESFMLAFDSNLKPMVGQQLTVDRSSDPNSVRPLFAAAKRGDCDLAVRQGDAGYLITAPDAVHPERSQVLDGFGRSFALSALTRVPGPVTLTCYPPQPGKAEARRSALDRDADGVTDRLERRNGTDPADSASH